MSLKDELLSKIAADREAGRDIPVVIEEMFLKIVDFLEPEEKASEDAPPIDNNHVAEGATQFTAEELAKAASQQTPPVAAPESASQAPADGAAEQ